MIHLVIEEENGVRHEFWENLKNKHPYYVCYEYILPVDSINNMLYNVNVNKQSRTAKTINTFQRRSEMTNYIDYVVCKHDESDKPYLFVAPAWSYLEPGDRVNVETKKGITQATVIASYTDTNDMDAVVNMFVAASGASWPLKRVVSKVIVKEMDWTDYDTGNGESEKTISEESENTEETTEHTEV